MQGALELRRLHLKDVGAPSGVAGLAPAYAYVE
jgi:hypothetical protein